MQKCIFRWGLLISFCSTLLTLPRDWMKYNITMHPLMDELCKISLRSKNLVVTFCQNFYFLVHASSSLLLLCVFRCNDCMQKKKGKNFDLKSCSIAKVGLSLTLLLLLWNCIFFFLFSFESPLSHSLTQLMRRFSYGTTFSFDCYFPKRNILMQFEGEWLDVLSIFKRLFVLFLGKLSFSLVQENARGVLCGHPFNDSPHYKGRVFAEMR